MALKTLPCISAMAISEFLTHAYLLSVWAPAMRTVHEEGSMSVSLHGWLWGGIHSYLFPTPFAQDSSDSKARSVESIHLLGLYWSYWNYTTYMREESALTGLKDSSCA